MKKLRGLVLLILVAVIWGTAFVAQSKAMDSIEPFTFNFVRCLIGSAVLLPLVPLMRRVNRGDGNPGSGGLSLKLSAAGLLCGTVLCIASNLQQFGIAMGDSVGKAGFITALYIVLVPLFGLALKQRVSRFIWFSVAAATIGLYLLCVDERITIKPSDIMLLCSAVFFAIHILLINHYSTLVDCVALSCVQLFVCGVLSGAAAFIFETPRMDMILDARLPLLYAGVLSCGVAYTLQIFGQRDLNPTVASLVMCLESVVAVIAGAIILKQRLSARELTGCCVMLAAIVTAQLPYPRTDKAKNGKGIGSGKV